MLTPIAAVLLVVGAVNTPAMIQAEREYLRQEPAIEIRDIQTSQLLPKGDLDTLVVPST
jgi:hypothetical protein